ncbi:MAG: 30S ribosomal protein S20 [Planctomycetes bacterium]|jgi:small subunit ribosomal protein S20|nr:30S ribosomal protein S20 [Planctomycetota bacterium]
MPNLKSAKKELRKSAKRKIKNKKTIDTLKSVIKGNRKAIANKDLSIKEKIVSTIKTIDKAAQQGAIKKNNANRKKSRLQKQLNQLLAKK